MAEELVSRSPAEPDDEIGRFPVADEGAVDAAVARARAAFPKWRALGAEARSAVLRRFAAVVRAREDDLARLVAREVGKALWEARAEAGLVPAKVDATLDHGLRFVAPIEGGPGAVASFEPRGVLAVLGPFNFPAHLPNGHVVPALATGNTVVWKPSELAPATAEWLAAAWREAGLPAGVLELVHGGGAVGKLLALHEDVAGVLFTGSWATGRALAEATLDQPGKLLALELGGKNAIVVLDDADLDLAVAESALSIAATTGQRCSSASRIFVARGIEARFTEKLVRVLGGLVAGPPLTPGVFMGPLVSHAAHDKLLRYRALARDAGGVRLLGAESPLRPPYAAAGLVRFSHTEQRHPYQREEIFGPEAALYSVDDLDHAVAAVNDADYGLAAAVFTRDRAAFEHAAPRIEAGIVNWNRGTVGASGRLPFGGGKRSGNDRPAGILSALYCTVPQARLEHAGGFDPRTLPPGMPRP